MNFLYWFQQAAKFQFNKACRSLQPPLKESWKTRRKKIPQMEHNGRETEEQAISMKPKRSHFDSSAPKIWDQVKPLLPPPRQIRVFLNSAIASLVGHSFLSLTETYLVFICRCWSRIMAQKAQTQDFSYSLLLNTSFSTIENGCGMWESGKCNVGMCVFFKSIF